MTDIKTGTRTHTHTHRCARAQANIHNFKHTHMHIKYICEHRERDRLAEKHVRRWERLHSNRDTSSLDCRHDER